MSATKVPAGTRTLAFGGVLVRCVEQVPTALARAWASGFREWFGDERRAVPTAPAAKHVALLDTPLGLAVAKRERVRGVKRALVRGRLKRFRSDEALERRLALDAAGIATAAPIATVTARASLEACSITRFVDGSDPWSYVTSAREPRRARERAVDALAELVADLHAAGFRHRDLKAPNLLVERAGARLRVAIVDVDGLARAPSVSRATRIRDLARLCVSFSSAAAHAAGVDDDDWKRCVDSYVRRAGVSELDVAELVARTRRWARAHAASLRGRGRAIA